MKLFQQKKSRIRETLNLSTDADHRTDIFFWGGDCKTKKKKKKEKEKRRKKDKNVTRDM